MLFCGGEKFCGIGEVMDNSRFRSFAENVSCYFICHTNRFVDNLKVILGKMERLSVGKYQLIHIYGLNMSNYFSKMKQS